MQVPDQPKRRSCFDVGAVLRPDANDTLESRLYGWAGQDAQPHDQGMMLDHPQLGLLVPLSDPLRYAQRSSAIVGTLGPAGAPQGIGLRNGFRCVICRLACNAGASADGLWWRWPAG
jgi:hypothetical protein